MNIDFIPIASLFGGSLIGISAVLLMISPGRVMGATGVLSGAILLNSLIKKR